MVRIQLHLTAEQDRALRALARRRGITRAELIRRGIDRILSEDEGSHDALLDLVGAAGEAVAPDLSDRHDDVLYRQDDVRWTTSPRVAESDPDLEE
jgi:hypothetical protein